MYSIVRHPRYRRHVHPLDRAFFGTSLAHDMDLLMDAMFADMQRPMVRPAPVPTVTAKQVDGALEIRMSLAGFEPEHLDVQLQGDVLSVSADTRRGAPDVDEPADDSDADPTPPRPVRTFQRRWRLNTEHYQLDKVEAKVEDDSLVVRVPHVPGPEVRRIAIRR